jgi:DNA-binding transcriptional regulator YhcF (GntR family)
MKNVYYLADTIHVCEKHMAVLSVDILFDAAVRIQLLERSITVAFADNTIRMKFPTTRRLAEFLDVPHYYVLPYFAMMEQEELVTRAERIGILTTAKGSRKMIELMREQYRKESSEILGKSIFEELLKRC